MPKNKFLVAVWNVIKTEKEKNANDFRSGFKFGYSKTKLIN